MSFAVDELQWSQDCRAELAMDHENEVFLKFALLAGIIGYPYVSYGLELPTGLSEPSFTFFCNYMSDWHEKFVDRNPRHHGSRVAYGKRSAPPKEGESDYFWSRCDFFREAEANNVTFDWCDVSPGRAGAVAYISLAGHPDGTRSANQGKAEILARLVRERMETLLQAKLMPQAGVALSDVERRYLMWVLDGKTTGEIADIMNISKPSVENLSRKLPAKLDTRGIVATAFLAFRMGLLTDAYVNVESTTLSAVLRERIGRIVKL